MAEQLTPEQKEQLKAEMKRIWLNPGGIFGIVLLVLGVALLIILLN